MDRDESAFEDAKCKFNKEKYSCVSVGTFASTLSLYSGTNIPHQELQLQVRIGRGGYGEVYLAKWNSAVVAVKKQRSNKGSTKYASKTVEEMIKCWNMSHSNIVHFLGACTEVHTLSIVMEYMPMCLHEALFIKQVDFSNKDLLKIIMGVCEGLLYMHGTANMAHCDLKTKNVLLDYDAKTLSRAKISDFGLSMSTTTPVTVRRVGTPRYSAPEVLSGRSLTGRAMMKSDIYSLGLLIYEVIFKTEPLCDIHREQVKEEVCEKKAVPEMPDTLKVDATMVQVLNRTWIHDPKDRPTVEVVRSTFQGKTKIFV